MAIDRHSGEIRWRRTAEYNFRHNAIAVAAGKVFCIDSLSEDKLQTLKRRGIEPSAPPRLLALDSKTGEELWSTDQDILLFPRTRRAAAGRLGLPRPGAR